MLPTTTTFAPKGGCACSRRLLHVLATATVCAMYGGSWTCSRQRWRVLHMEAARAPDIGRVCYQRRMCLLPTVAPCATDGDSVCYIRRSDVLPTAAVRAPDTDHVCSRRRWRRRVLHTMARCALDGGRACYIRRPRFLPMSAAGAPRVQRRVRCCKRTDDVGHYCCKPARPATTSPATALSPDVGRRCSEGPVPSTLAVAHRRRRPLLLQASEACYSISGASVVFLQAVGFCFLGQGCYFVPGESYVSNSRSWFLHRAMEVEPRIEVRSFLSLRDEVLDGMQPARRLRNGSDTPIGRLRRQRIPGYNPPGDAQHNPLCYTTGKILHMDLLKICAHLPREHGDIQI